MERIPKNQLAFVDVGNAWTAPEPVGEPPELERKLRPPRIITFSRIEQIIYEQEGIETSGPISANTAIGSAIDYFLVPAQFIYRYRADYCFDPNDPTYDREWDLANVLGMYYPTGHKRDEYLEILTYFRKDFIKENPLRPGNSQLERGAIKKRLIPLWNEIAGNFKLDSFELQHVMDQRGNVLLPSGRKASEESIRDIAQRIVVERFDSLVEDDPNYSYFAKPDCLLSYNVDGVDFSILVQPDSVERLRETVKAVKRRLEKGELKRSQTAVVKRIISDQKDTSVKDLSDPSTAYGKTMGIYQKLLRQIGRRIKLSPGNIKWINFPNDRVQRAFIIPSDSETSVPAESVETRIQFLRENATSMSIVMPEFNPETETRFDEILKDTLKRSTQSKLQAT